MPRTNRRPQIPMPPSSKAYVIDLYVDTKTKQIYSEPGEGRVRMGSFEKVSDQKPAPQPTAGEAALPSTGKAGEAIAPLRPLPNPREWVMQTGNRLIHSSGT